MENTWRMAAVFVQAGKAALHGISSVSAACLHEAYGRFAAGYRRRIGRFQLRQCQGSDRTL